MLECILFFKQRLFFSFFFVLSCLYLQRNSLSILDMYRSWPTSEALCMLYLYLPFLSNCNMYSASFMNRHTPRLIARDVSNGETYCSFRAKLQITWFNASLGFWVRQLLQPSKTQHSPVFEIQD